MIDPDDEGLTLDAATHRYEFGGKRVAGVTEILQGLGLIDARWFTDFGRERGAAVHAAVELLALGTLDWSSVDARIVGYVRAAEAFLAEAHFKRDDSLVVEYLVHHPVRGYAGKLDLSGTLFGDRAVVDFKTGDMGRANLQTAAYEEALRMERGDRLCYRRMGIQLHADGTYSKEDYYSVFDYIHWSYCCEIYNTYLIDRKDDADADRGY